MDDVDPSDDAAYHFPEVEDGGVHVFVADDIVDDGDESDVPSDSIRHDNIISNVMNKRVDDATLDRVDSGDDAASDVAQVEDGDFNGPYRCIMSVPSASPFILWIIFFRGGLCLFFTAILYFDNFFVAGMGEQATQQC